MGVGLARRGAVAAERRRSAPTFLPTDITNLYVWLDASALVLSDGAAVSSWTDSSGAGRHVVQATGAKQPTYRSTSAVVALPNSRPVVQFDGVDDNLAVTYGAEVMKSTAFAVVKFASTSGSPDIFDGTAAGARHQMGIRSGAVELYQGGGGVVNMPGTADTTTWHQHTAIYAGDSTSQGWTDGAAGTAGLAGGVAATGLRVGAQHDGTNEFLSGSVAEIVVYSRLLTSAERLQVEGYLKAKYGTP